MSDWMKEAVTRHGDAMFEGHPPSEWMVLWAEAREELTAEQRARIEQHLDVCGRCEEEVVMLQQVSGLAAAPSRSGAKTAAEASGGSTATDSGRSVPPTELRAERSKPSIGFFERLLAWIHGPAAVPAFALSLLLLVPAWWGFQGAGQAARDGAPAPIVTAPIFGVGTPTVLRSDVERGATVALARGEASPLLFTIPPRASGPQPVRVSFSPATGPANPKPFVIEDVEPLDEFGAYLVVLRTEDLAPGSYRLRVEDGDRVETFLLRLE